jgi:hypothetical protein
MDSGLAARRRAAMTEKFNEHTFAVARRIAPEVCWNSFVLA